MVEGFAILSWGGDVAGSTVWSPFPEDTDYFGDRSQQSMINYRVGRFGWASDPESHRFELWEPAPNT